MNIFEYNVVPFDIGLNIMIKDCSCCNCIICGEEFEPNEIKSEALSEINRTSFKICNSCLESSNPEDDYREAKSIVNAYIKFIEAYQLLSEAKDILKSK